MTSPTLVTGGTGTLGIHVVRRLREVGRGVRVLTRGHRPRSEAGVEYVSGDLRAGSGLEPAVDGVDTIVHCASGARGDAAATRNLVLAATALGRLPHVVYISIVGIDRVRFSYYLSKLATEQVVSRLGLPWTILRATQFFDLLYRGASSLAKLPVVAVPRDLLFQPIDADEVAGRLVELALADPAGRVPDLGGPEVLTSAQVVRTYLEVRQDSRRVVTVPLFGLGAVRAGGLLADPYPAENADRRTWSNFVSAAGL